MRRGWWRDRWTRAIGLSYRNGYYPPSRIGGRIGMPVPWEVGPRPAWERQLSIVLVIMPWVALVSIVINHSNWPLVVTAACVVVMLVRVGRAVVAGWVLKRRLLQAFGVRAFLLTLGRQPLPAGTREEAPGD